MEYRKAPYWVHEFLLFFFVISFCLNQTTLFAIGDSSELEVINETKSVVESLTLLFWKNCMNVNPDKFHLLFFLHAKMAA